MRRRAKPSGPVARARRLTEVDEATPAPPKRVTPALVEPFYVAVDRQLKSGYGTYAAAEKAALAIKKLYPHLQVTVYDAKEQRHTTIERPTVVADPRRKTSRTSSMTAQRRAVAGGRR